MNKRLESGPQWKWSRRLLLLLLVFDLARFAMANVQTADDALNCNAMALASTLIPPESVSEITKLPLGYVDAFYGSMHMVSQIYFAVYAVNTNGVGNWPMDKEIVKARDERLLELSFQYEQDAGEIQGLYLRCDAWAKALATYLESSGHDFRVSEEQTVDMLLSAPTMSYTPFFDEASTALGKSLASTAFDRFIESGRLTPSDRPTKTQRRTNSSPNSNQKAR